MNSELTICALNRSAFLRGITQVLLFKIKQDEASFRANGAKVSVNRHAVTDIGPTIRAKIRAYQSDYLSSIINL